VADVLTTAFGAMGTVCEVTLVGGSPALLELARAKVELLERRWSRFRADSEISRLNDRGGVATALSMESYLLVDRAVAGWRWTSGLYDPTVLRALEASGYDRSFDRIRGGSPGSAGAAPGCEGVAFDPSLRAVTLPPGVGFDPGGIGKGLAADLVVALLLAEGASGACLNLGGDGRVRGSPPRGGWRVGVGSPYNDGEVLSVVTLVDQGIATSSRLTRRWTADGGVVHHLIDPRSGRPVDRDVDAVTVVAREAWMAEVLSKAVFVAGAQACQELLARSGASALLVEGPERLVIV
jgi:thiamine biosynthesis lipoprotein